MDILGFGAAKEIFQSDLATLELPEGATLLDLRLLMEEKHPGLKRLGSYMIAVNKEYARDDRMRISAGDEIAIIPPVSGG